MTGVELELLSYPDIYPFLESGIRGVICTISKRYNRASNKYMPNFEEYNPSKYIIYLDANNLYGWAMIQHLPVNGFEWISKEEIENS